MQPDLPWSGRSPQAKHCSYLAAVRAATDRSRKSARYLAWLQTVGSCTDHGAAEHFAWPLSSICSIRNGLMERGLVAAVGITEGRYGRKVTIWRAVN